MTVEGPSYQEEQKVQVHCRKCEDEMAAGYLAGHRMTQHEKAAEERRSWKTLATGKEPRTYHMAFPSREARGAARWSDAQDERQ